MGDRVLSGAALLLVTFIPIVTWAQMMATPLAEGEEIGVDAAEISYDQKTDTVVARGDVVVTRGTTELRADEVRINRTTNVADAQGHVRLTTENEGTVVADEMHLSLDDETGTLTDAEIKSQRFRYTLWGDHIEKGVGQNYRIENGRFTSCNCADRAPDWSISGQDVQVTMGGYGQLKAGTFNVLDIPVLYLPRALFPAQRERATGFLLPRFGLSNRRGFQTFAPFYWAIDKSQDATVAFDVETSARIGFTAEYRYKLSADSSGILDGSYFNEFFRSPKNGDGTSYEPTIPINRGSLQAQQDQALVGSVRGYSDVFLVSDDLFLRDMNTYAYEHALEANIRTLPYTLSRVGALQLWDNFALKGEGVYYQDLTAESHSETLTRAPQVDAWGQTHLGDYILPDLNASAVNFQRGESVDGFRLDLEPGATVPLPLGPLVFGSVHGALRETAYHLTQTELSPDEQPPGITELRQVYLPRNQSRELVEVRGEIGTELNRVYAVDWLGLEKVKHTIEPSLGYLYVPAVEQTELPLFDGIDRVNQRNLFTYGLVSRFIGKFAGPAASDEESDTDDSDEDDSGSTNTAPSSSNGEIRELGRLSLFQSADISREINPLQLGRSADHFSDIDFGGTINPSRFLNIRFLTNYDVGNNNISAARIGMFLEDPRRALSGEEAQRLDTRTSLGVSYRVLTQNLLQEIDGNFVVRLTNWAGVFYTTRYDLVSKRFLNNDVGLRLISTCDCWALDIAVIDRTNPQEVEVRAQLTLAGFGPSPSRSRVAKMP